MPRPSLVRALTLLVIALAATLAGCDTTGKSTNNSGSSAPVRGGGGYN